MNLEKSRTQQAAHGNLIEGAYSTPRANTAGQSCARMACGVVSGSPGSAQIQKGHIVFREGVERAQIELPLGQMTHVLRHTFASHFMMAGGNILALQRILGHQSLTMTMRYSHLAPEHLKEAREFNPLTLCRRTNE